MGRTPECAGCRNVRPVGGSRACAEPFHRPAWRAVTRTARDRRARPVVGPRVRASQERPHSTRGLPYLFTGRPTAAGRRHRSERRVPRGDARGACRGTSPRPGDRSAGDSRPVATHHRSVPGTPGADRIRSKRLRRMWHIHHDAKRDPPQRTALRPGRTSRVDGAISRAGRAGAGARGPHHHLTLRTSGATPRRRLSAPALP